MRKQNHKMPGNGPKWPGGSLKIKNYITIL